jgi:hypothetical protein
MTTRVGSRLLALGVLWGLLLAVVPILTMGEPYQLTGLLIAALLCAALSGCIGTLAAGRRAVKSPARTRAAGRSGVLAGVRIGAIQGLVGGGAAALFFWVLMALTTSGFSLQNPVDVSTLMRPQAFLGSFFVALSVFLYAFVGGLLLSPVFGTLVNRIVRKNAEDGAAKKEDLVVR